MSKDIIKAIKDLIITIVAICSIVYLISYALSLEIDGAILATGIAAISGLGGYFGKSTIDKLHRRK